MAEERVLWEAEFNPRVTIYWMLSGAMILTASIVGIVLVPFWFVLGGYVTRRCLETYRCTLTNRSLKVAKGWFVKVESGRREPRGSRPPTPPDVLIVSGGFL